MIIIIKVSIIVPVYNVEEYIYECIKSLSSQNLQNIEIIVIDDGTRDNSIEIVKKFNDDRIKIISQKNAGLSAARNTGMRIAKGQYIAFVDSDDFIGFNEAYEEMYNIAINDESDIVSGNAIWYYSEKDKYPMPRNMELFSKSPMEAENFFCMCMKSNRIYAPVWLNLYKKSFLVNNDLWFKEGIYHEDEEFTPRTLLKANMISIYNKDFYVYRQREGSIMNSTLNHKRGFDIIDTCLSLEHIVDNIKNEELKYLFRTYLTSMSIEQIYKYKLTNISSKIKNNIIKHASSKPLKIRAILININPSIYIFIEKIYRIIKRIS